MNPTLAHFEQSAYSYRQKSESGWWGALRRYEKNVFLKLVTLPLGDVLELGCGAGFYTKALLDLSPKSMTCVDFSPSMLSQLESGVRKIHADLDGLCLDGDFDLVICAGALEFLKNPYGIFEKLDKHLRPRGRMLFLFPRKSWLGKAYQYRHRKNGVEVNLFSSEFFEEAIRHGLRLEESRQVAPFNWVARWVKDAPA